jgi:hypothetical protein
MANGAFEDRVLFLSRLELAGIKEADVATS